MTAARRLLARPLLALILLTPMLAGAPSSSSAGAPAPRLPVRVDPVLAGRLGGEPVPALVAYERTEEARRAVASHLSSAGLDHRVYEMVSVAVACVSSAEQVRELGRVPGVRSISGDRELTPALDKSVPTAFNGNPQAVWQGLGVTGKDAGIAVVDTGIDATHPDLELGRRTKRNVRVLVSHKENLGPGEIPGCPDYYTDDLQEAARDVTGQEVEDLEDTELASGHGTHVASVAAGDGTASGGRYRGVAPEADLMGVGAIENYNPSVRIADPSGSGDALWSSTTGVIAGLNYVVWKGLENFEEEGAKPEVLVKVVLAGWTQDGLYDPWYDPLVWALESMDLFEMSVVFPAGNAGPGASDCSSAEDCRINMLAASPSAISVAATQSKTDRVRLAPYSSRGDPSPRQAGDGLVRYEPDIAAPGTGVVAARRIGLSSVGQPKAVSDRLDPFNGAKPGAEGEARLDARMDHDHVALTGTSVAAAHVAGAIALMQQAAVDAKGCYLTAGDVREILAETATPMPGYAPWEAGAGMIDVTAAVDLARFWPPPRLPNGQPRPEPWVCPPWLDEPAG